MKLENNNLKNLSKLRSKIVESAPSDKEIHIFRKIIYNYYGNNGRDFPWRKTQDPYRIVVSEIMLQQTQTERVVEKYQKFITIFGGFQDLAEASLLDILSQWQGLGYNRRAIALQKTAQIVVEKFHGELPGDVEILMGLPGIGITTASEIAAFAFDIPTVFIETNIRRVFLYTFFPERKNVKDSEILPLVEQALDYNNPRAWYYALMDYGVMLKKAIPNPNRKSAHYARQASFEGSNRQIRGGIIRILVKGTSQSLAELAHILRSQESKVEKILNKLLDEGFLVRKGTDYAIKE